MDRLHVDLKSPFLTSQLITYLGNKRRLLPFLGQAFSMVQGTLGKDKLLVLDGFAGSGAPARLLKVFAEELYVNDMEAYCETLNRAYLANRSEVDADELEKHIAWLNAHRMPSPGAPPGFIETHYAPKDDDNIQFGERVFYTHDNARMIDYVRLLIEEEIPAEYRVFCLASLLVEASIHNNTSGVFKGFHKKGAIGHFGGRGEHALARIKADIFLDTPIFSDFECPVHVMRQDANVLVRDSSLPLFDLAYYDPPYNQHPYGSNYFMLNIINEGRPRDIQEGVSGIAKEWNRSDYNKRQIAEQAMDSLLRDTRARYIVISYNAEGIIPADVFKETLSKYGTWKLLEQDYHTYRGSRNLSGRSLKVKELLWVLRKDPALL